MILQTGQRTDIPAFYGQWLINRIHEGYVDVQMMTAFLGVAIQ